METFLEDLTRAINSSNAHFRVISGDFNAKIGQKIASDPNFIGNFGLGTRNHRGDMFVDFLNKENLFCLNTLFKKHKQRKWTWKSPDGRTKNEIDFILSNNKNICTNISVLNQFDTGSDHRLVRATLQFNLKIERNKLFRTYRFPTAETLEKKMTEYQRELEKKLEPTIILNSFDLNELNSKITDDIRSATKKICSRATKLSDPRLQPETLQLIEQRRKTPRDIADYQEINKKIHKSIRKDLRTFRTKP